MNNRRQSMVSIDKNVASRRQSVFGASSLTDPKGRRRSTIFRLGKRFSKPAILPEEERRQIARDRFRRAVFKVKAMIRFGFPMRRKEDEPRPVCNEKYENTYQLEPDEGRKFKSEVAQKALEYVLSDNLKTYKYSKFSAANFSRALSTMAMDRIKSLDYLRYKYVVNITISENKGQCFEFASRCLWDHKTDSSATAMLKTASFFAVATIHAVYLE